MIADEARNIASQLSDSATAIPANYRSACRARSRREFISKLAVAVEEADETVGWLELIVQAGVWPEPDVDPLRTEAHELLAILSASRRTAERNDPTREHSPDGGARPAPPRSRSRPE